MSDREHNRPSALVFGARNPGRAIIERLMDLRAATHELLLAPLAETWVP